MILAKRQSDSLKKIIISIIFFLILTWSFLYQLNKYEFNDYAWFGGDTWEYQSMAVNLAKGKGLTFGGAIDFDSYSFDQDKTGRLKTNVYPNMKSRKNFEYFIKTHKFNKTRPPGYPIFLALIYKIFGVHPLIAKIVQAILISLCSMFLVMLGYYYWRTIGLIVGILSSFLFTAFLAPNPTLILTEPLTIFCFFIWSFLFILWQKHPTLKRIFAVGLATGLCLLIRSNLPFALFILIFLLIPNPNFNRKKQAMIFLLGLAIIILPWSIYASRSTKQFTLISKQFYALLDGNNEIGMETGIWSPQWRREYKNDPRFFYNQPEIKSLSSPKKLIRFFWHYRDDLPRLFANKIDAAFRQLCLVRKFGETIIIFPLFLLIFWLSMGYYAIILLTKIFPSSFSKNFLTYERPMIFPLFFIATNFSIIILLFALDRLIAAFMPFMLLPAIYAPILFVKLVFNDIKHERSK